MDSESIFSKLEIRQQTGNISGIMLVLITKLIVKPKSSFCSYLRYIIFKANRNRKC